MHSDTCLCITYNQRWTRFQWPASKVGSVDLQVSHLDAAGSSMTIMPMNILQRVIVCTACVTCSQAVQKWCFSPERHPQHCVHHPVYVACSLFDCCGEPSPSPAEARRFRFYVPNTLGRHPPSRCLLYRWLP